MSDASTGIPPQLATALADRYRLERELGRGGMATVYLAEDMRHHRQVAIKVLRDDLTASLGAERFLREIAIAAGLTHPHVLPLHDSGESAGRLFYVMPFVDGPTLRQRLLRGGELPIGEAVRVLRDVADAIAYAHRRGVVHRDLKPENIMLAEGHALVADFGVAKALSEATGRQTLTTAGVALGTPTYMSPEQATADPNADHRSDIYAFGVLAYELLAGRPPFTGSSPQEVLAAQVTTAAVPVAQHRATIPPALAMLVMRCLEKKPADRWQRIEELLPTLEALLTPSGGITPHGTAPYGTAPFGVSGSGSPPSGARRMRVGVVMGILAAATLVVALLWSRRAERSASGTRADARIVVAWFDNRTSDSTLSDLGSLAAEWITDGLGREGIGGVVPSSIVRELMQGPLARAETPVSDLAARTSATIVVSGRYDRLGDSIAFRAEVRHLADDRVMASIGPVVGHRADTRAFAALQEQVAISLENHRQWGSTAQGQRPSSLAAFREYTRGYNDHFVFGRNLASIPFLRRAIELDPTWLAPRTQIVAAYGNVGDYRRADSVRAEAAEVRAAAPPLDQLQFDWVAVRHDEDYEGQYRVGLRLHELDPTNVYAVMLPAGRTGRARKVLEVAATRDTLNAASLEWRGNDAQPLWAHHALGQHQDELRLARWNRDRRGLDFGTAVWVARALAALGRAQEVEALLTEIQGIPEGTSNRGAVMLAATLEYLAHGARDSLARDLASRTVEYYRSLPDSTQQRFLPQITIAQLAAGAIEDARRTADRAVARSPESIAARGLQGFVAATSGDEATARAAEAWLVAQERPRLFGEHIAWQSYIAAARGECARAATLLRSALAKGQNYFDFAHHRYAAMGRARGCDALRSALAPRDG